MNNTLLTLTFCSGILLLIAAAPVQTVSAAPPYAVFGNDIPLSGTAPGNDFIYLFLTGPNLPADGISLVGGTPVVTGNAASFTRVEVSTDGSWSYTWNSGSVGRVLDQGTYVIYAIQEPRSLPDLDDAVYAELPVVFGPPVVTVTATVATPATTGSLRVDSTPLMSAVNLDGHPAGFTPIEISDVPPGTHTLAITRVGYVAYLTNITIAAGERREVFAVLRTLNATSSNPATVPPATTSPGRLATPTLVSLGAVALAVLGFRHRS
jgi:hypothetical protein